MFFKYTLMLWVILSDLILFAGSFDFSNLYFIKDATASSTRSGKFFYLKKYQGKNFGFIVNCEDSDASHESAILKSITGFSSPLIKVPAKNKVLSDAFEISHPGVKPFLYLRLCPSSPNNEIEFYKYMNSYYLKFANNFGSESFAEVLIKINSIPLMKLLLGKDYISNDDYFPLDQDPLLDGNEVFELNTMTDDVLDLDKVISDSYIDAFDEKIETYINNKNQDSAKLDIIAKVYLKDIRNEKETSVTLDPMRNQYLFSESLLKKMGCKNNLDCHYVIPFQNHIPGNYVVDKIENISYENISVLSEKDAENVFKTQLENGSLKKSEDSLESNREVFSIIEKSGNIKYSVVVSNKNKNKKFGYTINCVDEKIEDNILLSFLGNSTPIIPKKNRMNSHEFLLKYDIDPTGFLMLCPVVDGKNKISLLYDGEVYYLRFVNNFGRIKFSDLYHKIKSIDLLKALGLSPEVAIKVSSKDILDKDIFELEYFAPVPPAPKINPIIDVPKPAVNLNKKNYRFHHPDSNWSGLKSIYFKDTLHKIKNGVLVISKVVDNKVIEKIIDHSYLSIIALFLSEEDVVGVGNYAFWKIDAHNNKYIFPEKKLHLSYREFIDIDYIASNGTKVIMTKNNKFRWMENSEWRELPESLTSSPVVNALFSYKDGFLLIMNKVYFIDKRGLFHEMLDLRGEWRATENAAIIEGKLHSITTEGEYKITDMETGLSDKLDISLSPWWLTKS